MIIATSPADFQFEVSAVAARHLLGVYKMLATASNHNADEAFKVSGTEMYADCAVFYLKIAHLYECNAHSAALLSKKCQTFMNLGGGTLNIESLALNEAALRDEMKKLSKFYDSKQIIDEGEVE